MKTWKGLVLAVMCAGTAFAHHTEAVFDHTQVLSVTGTVKEFLWANPHTNIYLQVADADGRSQVLLFEGGAAVVMRRAGWAHDTLKVGDKLVLSYYPRRDQRSGGQLVTATLADGRTLGWRPTPQP